MMLNHDYTYCLSTFQPICMNCRRRIGDVLPPNFDEFWILQPVRSKDGTCKFFDDKRINRRNRRNYNPNKL